MIQPQYFVFAGGIDAKADWAAWNGEAFALDHPAFRQAVAWLREGHIADGTVLQLSDEQRQLVFPVRILIKVVGH